MTDESCSCSEAEAVENIAVRAAVPNILDPDQPLGIVLPAGSHLEIPKLDAWRLRPTRKTGIYKPSTVDAFADYFGRHMTDASTIWVHPTTGQVIGVIDDNDKSDPGWGEHRVVLQLDKTDEWKYWIENDRKMLSQVDFAEHVEGGLDDIAVPDGADLLEIAQTFHMTNGVTFRSSTRLSTGQQQFQYDEESKASAGTSGQLTVPTHIVLVIAPFFGETPSRIGARLRFRLREGRLTLGYLLDRPDVIIRDALEKVAETLSKRFELTYVGEPPRTYMG